MGRHEREEPRPYENTGSGSFERALLAFLGFWHRNLVDPVGDFFSRTADKLWGLPRSRRWAICLSLGALTLVLAVVVIQAVIQGDKRDYAITTTQVVEQGVLLEEDYAACMMSIDLQGRTIAAETSCATNASFPAGTRVSVVQDPADQERFLVVDPVQDWVPMPGDTWFAGGLIGVLLAFFVVLGVHRLLLHSSIPDSPLDARAVPTGADPVEKHPYPVMRGATDGFGESWEARKAAVGNGWLGFAEGDVRIRGSLLAALVILVTCLAIGLGSAANAEMEHDRQLARTQPIVTTVLLEKSSKGTSTMVRFGNEAVMLDYEPRWEIFLGIGQDIQVVEDPQRPGRLIPQEMADERGLFWILWDNAPTIIGWIVAVGFLAWLFVPRELAAVGGSLDRFLRRGKPRGRH